MRFPIYSGKTMPAFTLAAACACALFPASAAAVVTLPEQRRVSDGGADHIDCDWAMQRRATVGEEQIPCGNPAQNHARDEATQRRREAAMRDERRREERLRDEQRHEQQLHDERVHDERVHEERVREQQLHEERVHEERLRDARSHRYRPHG